MYGWRGKIGHIAPSRGDIFVYEFYAMAPPGVLMFNTTGTIRELDRDSIERQIARIEEAAIDLAQEGVDLIMIGGTPLFTSQGAGSDIETARRVQGRVGIPVTAGVTGEIAALRKLGLRTLAVATPHGAHLNAILKDFLESCGFRVIHMEGLDMQRNADISRLPEHASYRLAKKVFFESPEKPDGVFIPCPRWPTIHTISLLEGELKSPVVSSSLAYSWWCFTLLNVRHAFSGFGRLMESLS